MVSSENVQTKIDSETLLIVVDTHKKSYVEAPELLEKTNKIVVIDHHRRGTDFIDSKVY
ncbi:MAG: DHH family phosphoesterase [Clostridia bacterium]